MTIHRATLRLIVPSLLIVAASLWLTAISFRHSATAFYVAQAILLLSLLLLWVFYHRAVRPLNTIANGINLLREQDFSSRLARVGQADADRIVEMFNDMMQRLKNERLHIREQNHFLDLLINASPMGIIVLSHDRGISMLNKAAAGFLGLQLSDAAGRTLDSIPGPLAEAIAGLPRNSTSTLRLNNAMVFRCSHLSYMDRGYAHPFMLIERLTDEVMRAEREAYEKVIRMMAHEVNNSMAGISSIIDTSVESIDDTEISEALLACRRRCATMSEFISAFADVVRIPEPALAPTDINLFLHDTLRLLESLCAGRDINIRIVHAPAPAMALADTVLLEQVLLNLVKNAVESIGRKGTVTIRTESAPAAIVVEDDGPGIATDTQQKIFTPFYSSKATGRGLGLLFVSEVLNRHGCTYSLRTWPDGITRFSVVFPAMR